MQAGKVHLADWIGPVIRGWMAYYDRSRHSELHLLLSRINWHVQEWIRRNYRRLKPYKAMKRAGNLWVPKTYATRRFS